MLLRFTFQNHGSFRDETELSFVGSSLKAPVGRRMPFKDAPYGVIRVLALYGGNASGKSQALKALVQMANRVVRSHQDLKPDARIPRNPFRLDETSRSSPTVFACEFVLEDVRYHYGFAFHDTYFLEEWLYAWPRGVKQTWFRRQGRDKAEWYFGPSLTGRKAVIAELTRDNSLFLSVAAQNNHQELSRIYRFFSEKIALGIDVSSPDIVHTPMFPAGGPLLDASNHERLLKLLCAADLGISGIKLESREELIRKIISEGGMPQETSVVLAKLLEEQGPPNEIMLKHIGKGGHEEWFESRLESRGTITLLNQLAPILDALSKGSLLVVDELDASLHPRLCAEIVGLFTDPSSNPHGAQLVFTTHDETLLDVLHRDEVILVDKDQEGVSHLTPLTDYKTLARDDIRKAYHLGRFGGVPRVGKLSQWLTEAEATERG